MVSNLPEADVRLSRADRIRLLDLLAQIAPDMVRARRLLDRMGYPTRAVPVWTDDLTAAAWWTKVFNEFDLGQGTAPYWWLVTDLHATFARNPLLKELSDRYLSEPHDDIRGLAPAPAGPYVFLSYSRSDTTYIAELAQFLTAEGIGVWFDRKVRQGEQWLRLIRERIDNCSAFIPVMSPEAEQSRWVTLELDRANRKKKPVLPLLLSGPVFFTLTDVLYEDVTDGRMPRATYLAQLRHHVNR